MRERPTGKGDQQPEDVEVKPNEESYGIEPRAVKDRYRSQYGKHRCRPTGHGVREILRMEAGSPRMSVDIPPGLYTPIHSGLSWLVDPNKLKDHGLFGWYEIFKKVGFGPTKKLVGLTV